MLLDSLLITEALPCFGLKMMGKQWRIFVFFLLVGNLFVDLKFGWGSDALYHLT